MIGHEEKPSAEEEFFDAIFYNNRLKVLSILDSGFDINTANDLGQTPIYVAAAIYKNLPMVKMLSDYNPDYEQKSDMGYTPLSRILLREDKRVNLNTVLKIIRTLLKLGAKLTTYCHGALPLHIAIVTGCHTDIIGVLLTEDTVNIKDEHHERTPLHLAVLYGHINIVKMLIEYEYTNINMSDRAGGTPLILAAKMDNQKMVNLLLIRGADRHLKDHYGKEFSNYAVSKGKVDNSMRDINKLKISLEVSEEGSKESKNKSSIDLSKPGPSHTKVFSKRKKSKPYIIPTKLVKHQYIEAENNQNIYLSNSFTLPILQCKDYKLDTNPCRAPLGQLMNMCGNLTLDRSLESHRSEVVPSRSTASNSSQRSLSVNVNSPSSSLSESFADQFEFSVRVSSTSSSESDEIRNAKRRKLDYRLSDNSKNLKRSRMMQ